MLLKTERVLYVKLVENVHISLKYAYHKSAMESYSYFTTTQSPILLCHTANQTNILYNLHLVIDFC